MRIDLIRKIALYAVYIILLTCFQVSFPDKLSFNGQIAGLMFVFVVLSAYMFGFRDGVIVGIIVGVLRDSFAAPAVIDFGGNTITSVGIGAFVMFSAAVFGATVFTIKIKRKVPFAFLTVLTATVTYKLIGHSVIWVWNAVFSDNNYRLSASQIIIDSVGTQVLLNLACAIPIWLLLRFAGPYKKGINPALEDKGLMLGGDSSWLTI